ncbi:MAG: hypothetical protein LBN39_05425 [Planctomycetaceae bacterium]|jgi:hypothetical protein|nr:hypothetical protein [Planctomycetaceae bacterium]
MNRYHKNILPFLGCCVPLLIFSGCLLPPKSPRLTYKNIPLQEEVKSLNFCQETKTGRIEIIIEDRQTINEFISIIRSHTKDVKKAFGVEPFLPFHCEIFYFEDEPLDRIHRLSFSDTVVYVYENQYFTLLPEETAFVQQSLSKRFETSRR